MKEAPTAGKISWCCKVTTMLKYHDHHATMRQSASRSLTGSLDPFGSMVSRDAVLQRCPQLTTTPRLRRVSTRAFYPIATVEMVGTIKMPRTSLFYGKRIWKSRCNGCAIGGIAALAKFLLFSFPLANAKFHAHRDDPLPLQDAAKSNGKSHQRLHHHLPGFLLCGVRFFAMNAKGGRAASQRKTAAR